MTKTEFREELQQRRAALGPAYAGVLCLDFANSIEPRGGPPPVDLTDVDARDDFNDPYDVLAWAVDRNVFDAEQAGLLWEQVAAHPRRAAGLLRDTIELRDAVYRIFWRMAAGQDQQPGDPGRDRVGRDLDLVRTVYAEGVEAGALQLRPDGGLSVTWQKPQLRTVLWQVATATVETLRDVRPSRVKVCPGPGRGGVPCSWLFIDTTKNGSRRWCSMAECGTLMKTRRLSQRRRAQAGRGADGSAGSGRPER